jgi:hypothetical protein
MLSVFPDVWEKWDGMMVLPGSNYVRGAVRPRTFVLVRFCCVKCLPLGVLSPVAKVFICRGTESLGI